MKKNTRNAGDADSSLEKSLNVDSDGDSTEELTFRVTVKRRVSNLLSVAVDSHISFLEELIEECYEDREYEKPDDRFVHSPDYRSVVIYGERFTLTPQQARIIWVLHHEHDKGTLDVGLYYLVRSVLRKKYGHYRIQDIFRNDYVRNKLIRQGDGKGVYRLNLDPSN
jgi:hypothetical protein